MFEAREVPIEKRRELYDESLFVIREVSSFLSDLEEDPDYLLLDTDVQSVLEDNYGHDRDGYFHTISWFGEEIEIHESDVFRYYASFIRGSNLEPISIKDARIVLDKIAENIFYLSNDERFTERSFKGIRFGTGGDPAEFEDEESEDEEPEEEDDEEDVFTRLLVQSEEKGDLMLDTGEQLAHISMIIDILIGDAIGVKGMWLLASEMNTAADMVHEMHQTVMDLWEVYYRHTSRFIEGLLNA
jgi:hypothetical protein